ncbi:GFA family protein [Pseudomonas parafulva]|uniref:GFA family protein n=1 Tax=Pseudomonas parafulva TaxID=157782 RepID=UPI0005AAF51F|nr:GFA family protein [Pseudomonas parafulva]
MPGTFQGSCLCAAVGYQLLSPPKAISHCHCSQCRKAHGAAFASYGSVPRTHLRILRGADRIHSFASSATVQRQFCAACGSNLFWSRSEGEFAEWVSVALGTLDTPFQPAKQKHLHTDNAPSWHLPSGSSTPDSPPEKEIPCVP